MTTAATDTVEPPRYPVSVFRPAAELGRWTSIGLAGLVWLAAMVFLSRRLAGALSAPLDAGWLACVALIAAVAAIAARRLRRESAPPRYAWWAIHACLSAGLGLLALSTSLPGTSRLGLVSLWAIIGGEEIWAWWRLGGRGHRPVTPAEAPTATVAVAPAAPHDADPSARGLLGGEESLEEDLAEEEALQDDVLQQLTRTRSAGGGERLGGWLRVSLAAGQRNANVHLAFCPPFARTPQIALDQHDGPTARIRPVQILPYGARFDLKLAQACEEDTAIVLRLLAEAVPPEDADS